MAGWPLASTSGRKRARACSQSSVAPRRLAIAATSARSCGRSAKALSTSRSSAPQILARPPARLPRTQDAGLGERPIVMALNKADLPDQEERARMQREAAELGLRAMLMSASVGDGPSWGSRFLPGGRPAPQRGTATAG